MDAQEAEQQIRRLTAAGEDPALSDVEIGALVESAKRTDADGLLPSDPSWSPTWDLDQAVAHGWRTKAAAAAAMFDVNLQGLQFSRSQLYKQCVAQAEAYESGVAQAQDDISGSASGYTLEMPPPGWPSEVPFP
jgi:hypothetical protein